MRDFLSRDGVCSHTVGGRYLENVMLVPSLSVFNKGVIALLNSEVQLLDALNQLYVRKGTYVVMRTCATPSCFISSSLLEYGR